MKLVKIFGGLVIMITVLFFLMQKRHVPRRMRDRG